MTDSLPAVIRVGEGRGFVVDEKDDTRPYIVTAAHCLPRLPAPYPWSSPEERTYRDLLGPLQGKCDTWAECMFVDPVEDVAVLTRPDLFEKDLHFNAYIGAIIEDERPFPMRAPQGEKLQAWMLTLEGEWISAQIEVNKEWDRFEMDRDLTNGGMSGSPIVDKDGYAIGVVNTDGTAPCLSDALPSRILRLVLYGGEIG